VNVGQTSRTIEIRCQEHIRHLCHGQTEESAVAEHLLNTGHEIQFEKTHRLHRTTYMDHIVKEAIEIYLHAENFNREAGFIKLYMAAGSQFNETLSTMRNRQPRPSVMTF
jgi:hypothetical protein